MGSNKIKNYLMLIVSIGVVFISKVLLFPEVFGLCNKGSINCINNYINITHIFSYPSINIIQIIYFVFISVVVISFVLLFFKEVIFKTWLKFSAIFIPIFIIITISIARGTSGTLIFIDEKIGSIFLSTIFFLMSIILILSKTFRPNWKLWIVLPIAFIFSVVGVLVAVVIF